MNNLDQPAMPGFMFTEGHGRVKKSELGFEWYADGFSKREQAALTLRIPMSGDEELDKMIRASRRLDIATAAMNGLMASYGSHDIEDYGEMASDSFRLADALLKEAGL